MLERGYRFVKISICCEGFEVRYVIGREVYLA